MLLLLLLLRKVRLCLIALLCAVGIARGLVDSGNWWCALACSQGWGEGAKR